MRFWNDMNSWDGLRMTKALSRNDSVGSYLSEVADRSEGALLASWLLPHNLQRHPKVSRNCSRVTRRSRHCKPSGDVVHVARKCLSARGIWGCWVLLPRPEGRGYPLTSREARLQKGTSRIRSEEHT